MPDTFKLAVIDDHPLMRRGIAETLSEVAEFEVVALGGTAEEAVRVAVEGKPDVILLDAMMPGGGLEAARQIAIAAPASKIVMLSVREDAETVRAALQAGVRGYVTKGVPASELIDAVRKVIEGGSYVTPDLGARLIADGGGAARSAPEAATAGLGLSEREGDLLRLVGRGFSNYEIAETLGLAENTVKHQLTPLFRKLGVRNRTEAALLANSLDGASPPS